MTVAQLARTPGGVPAGGRFATHVHGADTLVLDDDGGPINPGWSWSAYDSTEFARRHFALVLSDLNRAQKSDDDETTLRHLGAAAAHAEFAIAITADPRDHPGTFGYSAAGLVERERKRPWIAKHGTFPAPPITPERRTELIQHFASRFVAVANQKTASAEAVPAAEGAMDGYWMALHLMAPSRSRANLESAAAAGETDPRTLALVAAGKTSRHGE